ncbi:hypothetical protein BDY19DRAFT_124776 [Irpex rosettiformis]|uniref:Uncharacterized protein n=1 Tax=Irpex rosettiformis TaxID=378272 RepID=A0ACB8U422_9APHY|nr:hypothetical protein BDY19DRAFT_124776 [Irpex rosettiformis]
MEFISTTVESAALPTTTATATTTTPSLSMSSLVPSSDAQHTSVSASTPHSHHGHHAAPSKGGNNSTLSLIGSANAARVRLTKDFRSLVRSNSSTVTRSNNDRGYGRHHQSASVQVQVGGSDARGRNISPHAPLLPGSALTHNDDTMEKPREESRAGRSFGARLVNFLNRSRSRSRSKKRRSRSMDDVVVAVPVSEMPTTKQLKTSSLGRKNPFNALLDSTNTSNSTSTSSGSGSKPATRSPSRPLSGATTVTDTTVKGLFQKSPRAREKSPEVPMAQPIHVQADIVGSHVNESQGGKTKRTNIFSVSISTPRSKHASRDSSASARAASSTPPGQSSRRPWSPRFASGSASPSSAGGHSSHSNTGGGSAGNPSMSRETPPPPVPPKSSAFTNTNTSASAFTPTTTPNSTPHSSAGKGKATRPRVTAPVARPQREDTITTLNSPPPPYQYAYQYQYPHQREYEGREAREEDEVSLAGRCSPLCGWTPPRLTPNKVKYGSGRDREWW